MNMSLTRPRRVMVVSTFAILAGACVIAGRAYAQQAPPAPNVVAVFEAEANRFIVTLSASGTQGEFVSGPRIPGGPAVTVTSKEHARQAISNLVPESTYTVRFRTRTFVNAGGRITSLFSPWTNYSFRTLSIAQSRPSTPSISEGRVIRDGIGNPSLEVLWSRSTDNSDPNTLVQYTVAVNGVSRDASICGFYCAGSPYTVVALPSIGSRIVVTARDSAGNVSLPSNELIVTKTAADL